MNPTRPTETDFAAYRPRLRAVAQRILGSRADAEDAVQETWIRLRRADIGDVTNLAGWLTTVTSRICLDMLRARATRPEPGWEAVDVVDESVTDPADETLLADSIGSALLVVLRRLTPAERVAFVLHDMFDVPFGEIAEILDREPAAARKLASRARSRVNRAGPVEPAGQPERGRIVAAFYAASRAGDLAALTRLLHPDVAFRADEVAARAWGAARMDGAAAVAERFRGAAREALPAWLDGSPGAVWAPDGTVRAAFVFAITDGVITRLNVVTDPDTLAALDPVLSPDWS